jgi:hypothetical protein
MSNSRQYFRKQLITIFFCFALCRLVAQKTEYFSNVNFDSSYCLVGTFEDTYEKNDSMTRSGFLINKLEDLIKLKREWVFKRKVPRINLEINAISIFEPDNRFEGMFTIIANTTPDPADPYFVLSDINKELLNITTKDSFECGLIENDNLIKTKSNKVKITVKCAKNLYDKYNNKRHQKGEWVKSPIEIKLFWKD